MAKLKFSKGILFLLIVISLIIISGCTRAECKQNPDCPAQACTIPTCEDKQCVYRLQKNCCGNKIMEEIESGRPGNKCTCPEDHGRCEGIPQLTIRSRQIDATYATYLCDPSQKCVLGIKSEDVVQQNFLDDINFGLFEASSVVKYNKPFDLNKDSVELKITLDDDDEDLIYPIKITRVRITYVSPTSRSEFLVGEKILNSQLSAVGGNVIITIPFNLKYSPEQVEEEGTFRYSIDFEYIRRVSEGRDADGSTRYTQQSVRDDYGSPSKKIYLVNSGEDE
jgi:hypothetical protein